MSSTQQAQLEAIANTPITCSEGSDCEQKWGRAADWVRQVSYYDIRVFSKRMIQTKGRSYYEHGTSHPAFTILKYASGKNVYTISYASFCDTIFDECKPSGLEIKANFVSYVLGRTQKVVAAGLP